MTKNSFLSTRKLTKTNSSSSASLFPCFPLLQRHLWPIRPIYPYQPRQLSVELIEHYIIISIKRLIPMQNPYPTPFSTQSSPWNSAQHLPYTDFFPFQHYHAHHLLAVLAFKFEALNSQFQKTRQEMVDLQNQLAEVRQLQKKSQKVCTFILLRQRGEKPRKEFTKHLGCPFPQCKSRYSSRIALRAHLRRAHKPTSDY